MRTSWKIQRTPFGEPKMTKAIWFNQAKLFNIFAMEGEKFMMARALGWINKDKEAPPLPWCVAMPRACPGCNDAICYCIGRTNIATRMSRRFGGGAQWLDQRWNKIFASRFKRRLKKASNSFSKIKEPMTITERLSLKCCAELVRCHCLSIRRVRD